MPFFDAVYSDNSAYIGYIPIVSRKGDTWRTVKAFRRDEIAERIAEIKLHDTCDYYITANTFTTTSRTGALLAYNNLVIDIDAHASDLTQQQAEVDAELHDIVFRINRDIMPPTVTHYTGRGVQLWFNIEQIPAKCYRLYNTASDALINAVQAVIDDNCYNHIDLDTTASKRPTGLYRLPYTINQKTKRRTHAEIQPTCYTIHSIIDALKAHTVSKATATPNKPPIKRADSNYINLHKARLNVLQALLSRQRIKGKRNTILFLYYNSLIQLYDTEPARRKLNALNKQLFEPLKQTEVNAIVKCLDNKSSYYNITKQRFCDMLSITDAFYSEHSNPRTAERKRKADAKQIRRGLIMSDIVACMRYKDIAERHGVSVRTVNNIAKEMQENARFNSLLNTG